MAGVAQGCFAPGLVVAKRIFREPHHSRATVNSGRRRQAQKLPGSGKFCLDGRPTVSFLPAVACCDRGVTHGGCLARLLHSLPPQRSWMQLKKAILPLAVLAVAALLTAAAAAHVIRSTPRAVRALLIDMLIARVSHAGAPAPAAAAPVAATGCLHRNRAGKFILIDTARDGVYLLEGGEAALQSAVGDTVKVTGRPVAASVPGDPATAAAPRLAVIGWRWVADGCRAPAHRQAWSPAARFSFGARRHSLADATVDRS